MKQQLHQEAQMIAVKHQEAWKMYDKKDEKESDELD